MSSIQRFAFVLPLALPLALGVAGCSSERANAPSEKPQAAQTQARIAYPDAARGDVADDYHGTQIADPYRWLEDPDSAQTRAWVEAENKLTFGYLDQIPERAQLRTRLTALWNYERFGMPQRGGDRYVFSRNDGLQNQAVMYVIDGIDGTPRVLLDPNTLSKDGTIAIATPSLSEDGKYLAYALADGGSDWNTWKVRDVATGKDLADELRWTKFTFPAWNHDDTGFYYARYDAPKEGVELEAVNYYQKLWFHLVGTPQDQDVLVYERPDQKEWQFNATVTEDGAYLVLEVSQGTDPKNRVFYKPLATPGAPVVELLNDFDANYSFVGNDGPVFWFFTNLEAPRGRIVAIDTAQPARAGWKELVPQSPRTLTSVNVVGDAFVCNYLEDAHTVVQVFDLAGKALRTVALPGLGTAAGFGGRRSRPETFYTYTSFTEPSAVFRYDVATGASKVFRAPKLAFDPSVYTTEQAFYASKDGTKVPIFLTYKKGLRKDGQNPTLLYGYGGFNIPMTPGFSPARIAWLELGGVYAVANLRGGGEYGEDWHAAGTKLHKQNVFDDFIAAGEWLVAQKYTSTPRLAIQGGSNGGLLVGACITQRPDLFGAALPAVGVMDMLRFQKFTIGWAWTSDYGSSDDPAQFAALRAYSPLHNIKPGTCYPPTMITTADHDDRVVPAHSFKFAAELQRAQGCSNPILIRIDVRAGHGAGKPTGKLIEQAADEMAFLVRELGMSVKGP